MSVSDLLAGKRVCVCGGSGGVGKTTTSAAIALGMAAEGAKVAVVTIDPAKRLANALGLEELENEPRRVEPERLAGAAASSTGELWAMMLDPKRTFDELIERVAADPERAEEIKRNRVYRELSTAVSGSQEFTAVAKLYELERDGDFDLLVLDTPPSRNALDFLDAPTRLTSFLEGRALKAFIRPTGLGMRVLGRGAAPLLGAMRRVTGVDLISDLTTFFGLLGDMTDDFSERARGVERMLKAKTTAFVLVTSAQEAADRRGDLVSPHAHRGRAPLRRRDRQPRAPRHPRRGRARRPRQRARRRAAGDLAARVAENFFDYHRLAQRDARNIARLRDELGDQPLLLVPHLDDDVHDVEGLLRVHRYLFASEAERERLIADVIA